MHDNPRYGNAQDWLDPVAALTRFRPPAPTPERKEAGEDGHSRFGIFVGNIGLLLAPEAPSEVFEGTPIYPMPNTPHWFGGVVSLRGNLVPVLDLETLLGLRDEYREPRRLLVLDKGDRAVAIVIDGLPRRLVLGERARQIPPLPPILTDYVRKVYVQERDIWLEIDFEAFFTMIGSQLAA